MQSSSAAHSTSSSRDCGNSRAFGTPPTAWPERPARCRKVAMARGEPSWQTRSTSPMSSPSSSEAVATSTFSSPRFRRCSASSRVSFDRLPWCAATASLPRMSPRCRAARSAMRRVLTNTSVVLCSHTSSATRRTPASTGRSTSRPPAAWAAARAPGRAAWHSRCRRWRSRPCRPRAAHPRRPGSAPPRRWASAWPTGRCAPAARRPCAAMHSACSRSSDSARWLPRLLAAMAWISSTITLRTVESILRPDAEPSST
jgi:hypothetical protein